MSFVLEKKELRTFKFSRQVILPGSVSTTSQTRGFLGVQRDKIIHNLSKRDAVSTLKIYTVGYRCYRKPDFLQLLMYRSLDFIFQ